MGNDISSSTTLFFQRSLSFVNVRLPDRIMRQRSATNGNGKPSRRRCYRSNDRRTSSPSSQDSQFQQPATTSALTNSSSSRVNHTSSQLYGNTRLTDIGIDDEYVDGVASENVVASGKSANRQIVGTKAKSSVRRSKSWRGGGRSPTSTRKKKPGASPAWNADSSKSSPGGTVDSDGLRRVRSPDLLINDSAVDDFDDFFERAAATASSTYYDDTGRRISCSGALVHYDNVGRGGGRRIFVDSVEDCSASASPPDSPARPRTLTLGGVGVIEGGRLFLRVPSPASDDLTSSSYSNRSTGAESFAADEHSESLPAKIRQKTSSITRGKSSSFRRTSGASSGVTVRFADDENMATTEEASGSGVDHVRNSLSPPSSRLSPPSPSTGGLDIAKSGLSNNNNRPISASVSPIPVVRNLKQSVSATELQKKRRADDRRKTIATAKPTETDELSPPLVNGKKSPSSTTRSASCGSIPLLTPAQITLIRQHWNQTYITKGPSVLGTHVFQRACFKVPAIKEVFNHVEFTDKLPNVDLLSKQHAKNVALLVDDIVKNLDHLDSLVPKLYEIGRKHSYYHNKGFHTSFWAVFAESFIDCTLEWGEKIRRVEEARKAWAILIAFVIDRMKVGFQDGKRNLTRQKLSSGDSMQNDGTGGCGSPPKL